MTTPRTAGLTRRGFLGVGAAALTLPVLGSCSAPSSTSSEPLKFWDMPWGTADYTKTAQGLVEGYAPPDGMPKVSYQSIQWDNFYQTFSSAVASNTGPAVSTGGGFQAFQFSEQGAIAYADNLVETMKSTGLYDDYLPGTIDSMKTDKGYVSVPWQLDSRVLWYRESLLQKAGVSPPSDWPTWLEAGKALKKIGVSAFGVGAGPGNSLGNHAMLCLMINNGGGLYDAEGNPDVLNDRNVEAMEFVREMVSLGIVDKAVVGYSGDNVYAQWKAGKFGIGYSSAGLPLSIGDDTGDVKVADPPVGPHGDKGSLYFASNIMMYTNTPSQEASEAFLLWYLNQLNTYWDADVNPALPILKSIINTPKFQGNAAKVKIINEWQPISKFFSAQASFMFGSLAAVDGGQAISQFSQAMLGGDVDARTALKTLQEGIKAVS